MNDYRKLGDMGEFRRLKHQLDRLMEQEYKVRSSCREQMFAVRHDIDTIHNCIDLIGYSGKEAVDITERRIKET